MVPFTEIKDRKKNWSGTENEFDFRLCEPEGPEAPPGKKLEVCQNNIEIRPIKNSATASKCSRERKSCILSI